MLKARTGLIANYTNFSRLDFELSYDFYALGKSKGYNNPVYIWDNNTFSLLSFGIYGVYDGHAAQSKFWNDSRLDFAAIAAYGDKFYYSYTVQGKYSLPLGKGLHRLNFLAYTSVRRMPYELQTAWDYTYFGAPTRDFVHSEVDYQINFTNIETGFYLKLGMNTGGYAKETIDPLFANDIVSYMPYSLMDSWYLGFTGSFGYSMGYGDIELRLDITNRGRYRISLGLK